MGVGERRRERKESKWVCLTKRHRERKKIGGQKAIASKSEREVS